MHRRRLSREEWNFSNFSKYAGDHWMETTSINKISGFNKDEVAICYNNPEDLLVGRILVQKNKN